MTTLLAPLSHLSNLLPVAQQAICRHARRIGKLISPYRIRAEPLLPALLAHPLPEPLAQLLDGWVLRHDLFQPALRDIQLALEHLQLPCRIVVDPEMRGRDPVELVLP